jgi:hypothetical protein
MIIDTLAVSCNIIRNRVYQLDAQEATQPRLHPNGFIQLDFDDDRRLHIFPGPQDRASLPQPLVRANIHDHSYDLESRVLGGALETSIFSQPFLVYGGAYRIWFVSHYNEAGQADMMQMHPLSRYDSHQILQFTVGQGHSYSLSACHIHQARWSSATVTLCRRGPIPGRRPARVLCNADLEPDNTFHRDCVDPKVLWNIIYKEIENLHDV